MTMQIEAIYENGVLRPVNPIELPEGQHLQLILVTSDNDQSAKKEAGDITRFFGTASLNNPTGADNESIDRDLAIEYGAPHEE